ncbi:phosphoethanolamine--lipid A transferase [Catenovulum sp. 2E275]|uniref:phosphoethanolamine transferase n=1 Tax=Catenovulum sp. 2E275 TaxID=2980497 RepID=UPI0021CE8DEC|nr:phosphoethanolamine--lipid A transferase [Catenovulum sp. 2E275]MCU4675339.1 phosphoethanolamine--lipid A transferase [Catenovulum sp. 2E275]
MKLAKLLPPKTYSALLIFISIYTSLIFNSLFITKVFYSTTLTSVQSILFLISVPLLLFLICLILYSWLSLIIFVRLTLVISVLISAVLLYASNNYGVIFDKSMLTNIVETNTGEALSYLNFHLVIFVLLLTVLPLSLLFNYQSNESLFCKIKSFIKINLIAGLGIVLIALPLYQTYAAVGRNNKEVIQYIVPFSFYVTGFKYIRDTYFLPPLPFKLLDKSPRLTKHQIRTVTVMVVGETARTQNFSLGNYEKSTNQYTQAEQVKFFTQVQSCGTATAISVPCMFSRLDRKEYTSRLAESQENVIDIIHRAGTKVLWLDNNSSCKGVCKRVDSINIQAKNTPFCKGHHCFDEALLAPLSQALDAENQFNQFIILHLIGSHGPTYYQRYPKRFNVFTPDCARSDIQNCSPTQLINTYDNTLLYTDYVLAQIIKLLKQNLADQVSLLYISDHGESLGENGLYLHGFPYQLAPQEQTHIPMLYWSNQLTKPAYTQCLNHFLDQPLTHDNIYDILLGLTNTQSKTYQAQRDIFNVCRMIEES